MIEQFLCNLPDKKTVDKKNRLFYAFSICITPQIECYRVNWIIPMKEIPAEIRVLYDALLIKKTATERYQFYYRKLNRRNTPSGQCNVL